MEPPKKRSKQSDVKRNKGKSRLDESISPSRFRGNRGKLTRFKKDLPLEVFEMILSYLSPSSLLALARTSREFRSWILISHKIWKDAFAHDDCPPKPVDLNYPEYAVLMYETHCMRCGTKKVTKVNYMLRKRLCDNCWSRNILSPSGISENDYPLFKELEPCIHYSRDHKIPYTVPVKERRISEVVDERAGATHVIYYKPEIETQHAKLMELKEAMELEEQLFRDKDNSKNGIAECALREWKEKRIGLCQKLLVHGHLCRVWAKNYALQNRRQTRETNMDMRGSRKASIKAKLKALGWEDIDVDSDVVQQSRYVNQPRELTERIWSGIKDPLTELLTSVKNDRLKDQGHE